MMVDSDHVGDVSDFCYRTGNMIYVEISLIDWLSNKQATVDKAVFGSDFVDMTHGVKTLHGLRFKFRMIGVPVYGPTSIFGDNISVIFNTSRPDSQLKKKLNSIFYHAVREAVAMGECINNHIPTLFNYAYLLTKGLHEQKRRNLVNGILFVIYEYDLN